MIIIYPQRRTNQKCDSARCGLIAKSVLGEVKLKKLFVEELNSTRYLRQAIFEIPTRRCYYYSNYSALKRPSKIPGQSIFHRSDLIVVSALL